MAKVMAMFHNLIERARLTEFSLRDNPLSRSLSLFSFSVSLCMFGILHALNIRKLI